MNCSLIQLLHLNLRIHKESGGGCPSTTFSTLGFSYYKVCGQVRGYQFFHTVDALIPLGRGIDSFYFDDISITHGKSPHKHTWKYVGGLQENRRNSLGCPCNKGYTGGRNVATFLYLQPLLQPY